jgi:glycosyltransferase involved in cell wall biosynthesis
MKIGIIVPCYNEEENIYEVFKKLEDFKSKNNKHLIKLIFIDDGSVDETYKNIKIYNYDYIYKLSKNHGLGHATRVGMEIAHYIDCDICIKFDADLQHQTEDFNSIIENFEKDSSDIIYASRFKGKIHYKMPLYRYLGNKFFTTMMNLITDFKITDAQTGLMAFNKKFLTMFEMPGSYNPPQQAIFDGYFKGLRYKETSAEFYPRKKGKSFIKFNYIYNVFINLFKIFYKHFFYKIYLAISFFSFIVLFYLTFDVIRNFMIKSSIYMNHHTSYIGALIIFLMSFHQGINLYSKNKEKYYFRDKEKDNYLYFSKNFLECKER